ncbi:MAG: PfkB family carbohydrate kinase [Streptosporangiaceae bacterium]
MTRAPMLAVGVGEVLWDRLPGGDEIGGAPFNVVSHLARLGHPAACLTAVGWDSPGDAVIARMASQGIDTSLVGRVGGIPTGLAQVSLPPGGGPAFTIMRPAAFEHWAAGDPGRVIAMRPGLLVYGTLAQVRLRARVRLGEIMVGCPAAMALYDVNLRDGWWSPEVVADLLELASVVKLSVAEARELAPVLGLAWQDDPAAFSVKLARQRGLRAVAITAGPDAASLWLDGDFARAAPPSAKVIGPGRADDAAAAGESVSAGDSVGAGDAFAAALLDAIGTGLTAAPALRRANALGALVASRRGAQPPWTPTELAALEEASQ